MHTFSPAKMWIAGLDALQTPLLHLHTQANAALPWAEIDMDFMNLNQAAHGDREFGYIQTRLGRRPQDRGRPRVRPAVSARGSAPGSGRRVGYAAIRRLKLARFGDNMRDVAVTEGDKVEAAAEVRRLGQHLRRQRSGRRWSTQIADAEVDDLITEYGDLYDLLPSWPSGASGTSRCATAPGSRWACGPS